MRKNTEVSYHPLKDTQETRERNNNTTAYPGSNLATDLSHEVTLPLASSPASNTRVPITLATIFGEKYKSQNFISLGDMQSMMRFLCNNEKKYCQTIAEKLNIHFDKQDTVGNTSGNEDERNDTTPPPEKNETIQIMQSEETTCPNCEKLRKELELMKQKEDIRLKAKEFKYNEHSHTSGAQMIQNLKSCKGPLYFEQDIAKSFIEMKNHLLEETLTKRNKLFEIIQNENDILNVKLKVLRDELDIKEIKLLEMNISNSEIKDLPVDTLKDRIYFLNSLLMKYKRHRGTIVSSITDHFRAAEMTRGSIAQDSRINHTPAFIENTSNKRKSVNRRLKIKVNETPDVSKDIQNPRLFEDSLDSDPQYIEGRVFDKNSSRLANIEIN